METTTKLIIKGLSRQLADRFLPVARQLRKEGNSDYDIKKCFLDFVKQEKARFYNMQHAPRHICDTVGAELARKADSRIEIKYCQIFEAAGVPYKFQYKIGPYRADFLIGLNIIFEIDGPTHDKKKDDIRDRYMTKHGYLIFRVPEWLAAISHKAIVDEIKDLIIT